MASASFKGSFAGTRIPFSPSLIISGIPPIDVPITGVSHAIASKSTIPKASNREGRIKIVAF